VDLARLVSQVVDPYRLGIAERVSFDIALSSDLPPVWADRTLLSRALTNLIENAIQAMPAGGTLRIDAVHRGDRAVLRVDDTGVGMDAEALERAFEPFFSTKTAGSGLGLANARRNIETGGGTVSIASRPGSGTTVTVSLPLASPGAPGGASSPSR
jgi:two-component system sensor histidine kinase FlrB